MKFVIIWFLFLCTDFAPGSANEHEYKTVKDALEALTTIVINYDEKLDHSAKFPELQAAIDSIAESMHVYHGQAKNRLPRIRQLNTEARVEYHTCVGPVFEWCRSMNSTLDLYIKYIEEGMSVKDRQYAWKVAGRLLRQGLDTSALALDNIKNVQIKMASLNDEFKNLMNDIKIDFGPQGEYGKLKQQLQEGSNQIRTNKIIAGAVGTLFFIFSIVVGIVKGPIGISLGLRAIFSTAGVVLHLEKERQDIDNQIKGIQLLFNTLNDKTREALDIIKEIEDALKVEQTHLHSMKRLIQSADTSGRSLMADNEDRRRDLIPTYQNLGASCLRYTIRHGLVIENDGHRRRRRRHVEDVCNGKRTELMTTFVSAMRLNETSDIDRYNSFADGIHCQTVFLFTSRDHISSLLSSDNHPATTDNSIKTALQGDFSTAHNQ